MKKFIQEFKEFALKGNMMDMAIGIIIGGAFTAVVTSLTDNFIKPLLNFLTGAAKYTGADIAGFASSFISAFVTKKCPYCCSEIDINATRCPHCTSVIEEKSE